MQDGTTGGTRTIRRIVPGSAALRNLLLVLVATAVAGSIAAVPRESTRFVRRDTGVAAGGPESEELAGEAATAEGLTGEGSTATGPGKQGAAATKEAAGAAGAQCAPGKNGGATDRGVSATSIGLASTIVTSGVGSTFLGLSQYGMQAVVAKVNSQGGICGRSLSLKLVNDNWEAARGHNTLKIFINDPGVFALPVVPSSEGLRAAAADIKQAGIPVIGSDGMLIDQYDNPWIWPVATATVSQVRIMAKYAYDRGARTFAIVYDQQYRFGVEGKDAFEKYVRTLPGAKFVRAEPVLPAQPGYNAEIGRLNQACGADNCDVVVMLTDPGTAEVWIAGDDKWPSRAEFRFGASPLFNDRFGQNCKSRCDGMAVFTGYVPALEGNTSLAGIQRYVQDVRSVQPSADTANQFLQGSYLGMTVFVDALKKTGGNLTRARLREVMNSFDYASDLSSPLSWRADKRFANTQAQVWQIQASASFDGFRDLRTGWLPDPGL